MERSCLCNELDSITVIYLAVCGSAEDRLCGSSDSIKLNVCLGHFGVFSAVCIYPRNDLGSVV